MFELHDAQMFMYFGCKQGAGQAALLTGSILLPRKIEISKLQDAANEVFKANNGLRAVFVEKDEKIYQDVKPYEPQEFKVMHFNSKEEVDEFGEVYGTIPLKLPIRVEGPLIAVASLVGERRLYGAQQHVSSCCARAP